MNLSPESRSRPHNLLLVGLTEGKPKDLPRLLDLFSDLQDFMVGDQLWRPIICFVSADLPALASALGSRGTVRCSAASGATWLRRTWALASAMSATIVSFRVWRSPQQLFWGEATRAGWKGRPYIPSGGVFGLAVSTFSPKFSSRFLQNITLDATVGIRLVMTSQRSVHSRKV